MKKGSTLVEVIVSIAVFAVISVALFTSFLGMRKMVAKQDELLRCENACRDIAFYGDEYGKEWDKHYFGLSESQESGEVFLKSDFKPIEKVEDAAYRLVYAYENGELIISIYKQIDGKPMIENLNYGGGRYAS